jgi:hypothetical protein
MMASITLRLRCLGMSRNASTCRCGYILLHLAKAIPVLAFMSGNREDAQNESVLVNHFQDLLRRLSAIFHNRRHNLIDRVQGALAGKVVVIHHDAKRDAIATDGRRISRKRIHMT